MATALTGLFVWDGRSDRASRSPCTIRIESGRIAGVGPHPELAVNAKEIPLHRGYALPGLIDAHVHLTLDPHISSPSGQRRVPRAERVAAMERRALRMLRAGITTARDLGGGEWLELDLRDRIHRGEIPGPRLLCAGQPITCPGGHCHFWGGEAAGARRIEAVIRRQVEHGVDWIKVMATGGLMTRGTRASAAQFSTEDLSHVVSESARRGLFVAAHCHGSEGIRRAAEAGVRTIEHCSFAGKKGFGSDPDPDALRAIALRSHGAERSQAASPPQAGAQRGVAERSQSESAGPLWISPTVNHGWDRLTRSGVEPTAFGQRMQRVLRQLAEAGARFVASSDAGIPGVEHHGLARGLVLFAALAGLSPVQALRAATCEAAAALGLEGETGALEPGLAADILVVDGNPLEDLSSLLRPRLVSARGGIQANLGDSDPAGGGT